MLLDAGVSVLQAVAVVDRSGGAAAERLAASPSPTSGWCRRPTSGSEHDAAGGFPFPAPDVVAGSRRGSLLVIGVDILLEQRIFRPLQEALFPADSPQIFEPRDTIWAWAFIVIGAAMVAWGLKELLAPAKVVTADAAGLYLRLSGPFRPPSLIRWSDLISVRETFDDGGEAVEALIVEVGDDAELPDDPWGARWIESGTLAMLAEGWDQPAGVVAHRSSPA